MVNFFSVSGKEIHWHLHSRRGWAEDFWSKKVTDGKRKRPCEVPMAILHKVLISNFLAGFQGIVPGCEKVSFLTDFRMPSFVPWQLNYSHSMLCVWLPQYMVICGIRKCPLVDVLYVLSCFRAPMLVKKWSWNFPLFDYGCYGVGADFMHIYYTIKVKLFNSDMRRAMHWSRAVRTCIIRQGSSIAFWCSSLCLLIARAFL